MASKLPIFETPFESYQALKLLGEGGAGRVYEASDSAGNTVAIKYLVPERISAEKQKRFKNEISFCQKQDHGNILQILDTGVTYIRETKCPFYVMPLYSGTLRSRMANIQPNSVLTFFSQILDGVEAAHLMGVWHRDIKPENVLWSDEGNQFVVADFGIAHFEEDEIYTAVETKVASRMANFQYSAPEQRTRGEQVDHRADIFSLGLILNELFTGEIPQGTGYKRISDVDQEYSYLDEMVESIIQQQQENRPNSIEEIKKELIGQKNAFVALQRLEETKNHVVKENEPPEFEDIYITGIDYSNGILTLALSKNVPPGWSQEFQQPRDGHSSVMGYGPENFQFGVDQVTIRVREDANFVQKIVDHAKNYVSAANRGYIEQLREKGRQKEMKQREQYEKEVAEATLRKNILSRVKI